jgi:hypothetical protein
VPVSRPVDSPTTSISLTATLEIALVELRDLRAATRTELAETLGTSRPNVGRVEKEVDVRPSTLERYGQSAPTQGTGGQGPVNTRGARKRTEVTAQMSVSLDGFYTGPRDTRHQCHGPADVRRRRGPLGRGAAVRAPVLVVTHRPRGVLERRGDTSCARC